MEVKDLDSEKLSTLDEFEDIHKGVAFHFTPNQNIDNILYTGFEPRIGVNSSGLLGKEAIPKTFISHGLEGVMRMYNHMVNIVSSVKASKLDTDEHRCFIPSNVDLNNPDHQLTILEGFEFLRQHMENNTYFVIL